MSLIKYNSALNDFVPTTFSNLVDRFFNESVSRMGGSSASFIPQVDIVEDDNAYEIHVAVPGMNKEDFKIDLNDNYLTVSGERKITKKEDKKENFRSIETHYGKFTRSFSLPDNIDSGKINAKYVNGILEITIPKDEKKALKASIKVS